MAIVDLGEQKQSGIVDLGSATHPDSRIADLGPVSDPHSAPKKPQSWWNYLTNPHPTTGIFKEQTADEMTRELLQKNPDSLTQAKRAMTHAESRVYSTFEPMFSHPAQSAISLATAPVVVPATLGYRSIQRLLGNKNVTARGMLQEATGIALEEYRDAMRTGDWDKFLGTALGDAISLKAITGAFEGGKGFSRAVGLSGPERLMPGRAALPFHPGIADLSGVPARMSPYNPSILAFTYHFPLLRNIASALDVKPPELLSKAWRMVEDTENLHNALNFEAGALHRFLTGTISKDELRIEKMGYVLQGIMSEEDAGLSPQAIEGLKRIRDFNEKHDAQLREVYGNDISLQDYAEYLAQMYDMFKLKPQARLVAARVLMHDKFFKAKIYSNYKEALELAGLKPLYDNVADTVLARARYANRALANTRLAKSMEAAGWLEKASAKNLAAKPFIANWPSLENGILDKLVYAGTTAEGDKILKPRPVKVHPKIFQAAKAVFSYNLFTKPYSEMSTFEHMIFPLEAYRAIAKEFKLGWSFFHHQALGEQAQALTLPRVAGRAVGGVLESLGLQDKSGRAPITFRDIRKAAMGPAAFLTDPTYYKGVAAGIVRLVEPLTEDSEGLLGKAINRAASRASKKEWATPPIWTWEPEFVRDSLMHGLELNSHEGESRILEATARLPGLLGKVGQVFGGMDKLWNTSLWEFYHQGQMLEAYHSLVGDEINRLGPGESSPEAIAEIKRAVAKHVNDAFGALNFKRLLQDPHMEFALKWMFFAPSWTISNLRIPLRMFENTVGGRLARKWAIGAAMSWFTTTQVLNYAYTSYYNMQDKHGKRGGHFSWDNAGPPAKVYIPGYGNAYIPGLSENAFNIATGYNADGPNGTNGTERYILFGKAFREPLMWLMTFPSMLFNKLGGNPKLFAKLVSIYSGSSDTKNREAIYALLSPAIPFALSETVQNIGHSFAPAQIPKVKSAQQYLSNPARPGYKPYNAARDLAKAWADKDDVRAAQILQAAAVNGLQLDNGPGSIQEMARSMRTKNYNLEHDIHKHPSIVGQPRSEAIPPEAVQHLKPEVRGAAISLLGLAALASAENLKNPKFNEIALESATKALNELPASMTREETTKLWKAGDRQLAPLKAAYEAGIPTVRNLLDGSRLHIHGNPGTTIMAKLSRYFIRTGEGSPSLANFEARRVFDHNSFAGSLDSMIHLIDGSLKTMHSWTDFYNAAETIVKAVQGAEPEQVRVYRGLGIDLNDLDSTQRMRAKELIALRPGDKFELPMLQAFSDSASVANTFGSATHSPEDGKYRVLLETVGPVKRLHIAPLNHFSEEENLTFGRWEVVHVEDTGTHTAGWILQDTKPLKISSSTDHRRIVIRQLDTFEPVGSKGAELGKAVRGKSLTGDYPLWLKLLTQMKADGVTLPPGYKWEAVNLKGTGSNPRGRYLMIRGPGMFLAGPFGNAPDAKAAATTLWFDPAEYQPPAPDNSVNWEDIHEEIP